MYICEMCDSRFSEPKSVKYCLEDYNGVGSMFPDKHYGYYDACPYCGSEDIRSYSEDEEGVEL